MALERQACWIVTCAVTALVAWPSSAPADVLEDGSWKVQSPAPFENERFGKDVVLLDDLMLVGSCNSAGEGVNGQAVLFQ